MDAVTLDGLVAELAPFLTGRYLSRPRLVSAGALAFEVSGGREHRLWLDAERGTGGLYRLTREESHRLEALAGDERPGRARQLLLHARKHLDGARVLALRRLPGERAVLLETGAGVLALRLSGAAPALTLVRDGEVLGSLGEGLDAWPLPDPDPDREWNRIPPAALFAAEPEGSRTRRVLTACPGLGPVLARELEDASSFTALRVRLASPRPTLLAPGPPESWHDADLAAAPPLLVPVAVDRPPLVPLASPTWSSAAALFLQGRRRGAAFARVHGHALAEVRRRLSRHLRLERHLAEDAAGFPDETLLRRQGEALLASPQALLPGQTEVAVADPYEAGRTLTIPVDPRLKAPANADRRFEKARRIERGRRQVEGRLRETRAALAVERDRERQLLEARDLADVPATEDGLRGRGRGAKRAKPGEEAGGPRVYLTTRGMTLLVGRGAKENHEVTFAQARPDDFWLHARDVPGAHVILRDDQGRAEADDLREAAEVAAFFSEARGDSAVDVHVTRRKHLRPAGGGPGRVAIGHSDTLRAVPRDPEGRLRRR